jgi:hypothetical protein
VAFAEDDFEGKGFKAFRPDPELFAHAASMCQVAGRAARIGGWNKWNETIAGLHGREND